MPISTWNSLKEEWDLRDNFPFPPEIIMSSLTMIHKHFGQGFENDPQRKNLGKSIILLELVELGLALETAERIGSPQKLITKLRSHRDSDEFHVGLSETAVIKRILPFSDSVEYESGIPGFSKKPDILQKVGEQLIQYEVHQSSESAQENERDKMIKDLANEVLTNFNIGVLDIYLKEIHLSKSQVDLILNRIGSLSSEENDIEIEMDEIGFIYYTPTGSLRFPEDREGEDLPEDGCSGFSWDPQCDRHVALQKKIGPRSRYPGLVLYTIGEDKFGHRARKLVRIWRQTFDDRVWRKLIDEAGQLSDEHQSVVVIDMGGTTALIDEWMKIVSSEITSGLHQTPSAVWLRRLNHGLAIYSWEENFITNPIAKQPLDPGIIRKIFPPNKSKYTIRTLD